MLISPNHATADNITTETIVKATFDGEYEGDRKPSSESPMPGAVVHTHSDYCVAVSCHVMTLPGFHYLLGCLAVTMCPVSLIPHLAANRLPKTHPKRSMTAPHVSSETTAWSATDQP